MSLAEVRTTKSFYEDSRHVQELTPSDFSDQGQAWTLKNPSSDQTAIIFYAPWCPHCQRFKETWESLYRINGCMKLAAFNCAKYNDYYVSKLKTSEAVRGFPTIAFYSGKEIKETYRGPRDPPDELVKAMLLFCQRVNFGDGAGSKTL